MGELRQQLYEYVKFNKLDKVLEIREQLTTELCIYGLNIAAEHGFIDVAHALIEQKPDIVTDPWALTAAASNGHVHIVKYLHFYGSKLEVNGHLPLRLSARNGHHQVVSYLLAHREPVNALSDVILPEMTRQGNVNMILLLLSYKFYKGLTNAFYTMVERDDLHFLAETVLGLDLIPRDLVRNMQLFELNDPPMAYTLVQYGALPTNFSLPISLQLETEK